MSVVAVVFLTKPETGTNVQLRSVVAPAGQLVPFARQTEEPFTAIADAKIFEDVTVEAFSHVPVAPVKRRFVNVPFVAKRFVEVTDVPVPFVKVRVWRADVPVTVRLVTRSFRMFVLTANRLVEVVFVPVAFVQVMLVGLMVVTVRLEMVALVAKKLVVVALVDVTFVNTPVDGTVAPIAVPLMEPPEIVAFWDVKELIVPFDAFTVVPLAVVKPSQEVLVPFVKERFVTVPFVVKRFVVVTLVPVPFVKVSAWREVLPSTVKVEVTVEEAARKPPKS
jgi:hypothetical protein